MRFHQKAWGTLMRIWAQGPRLPLTIHASKRMMERRISDQQVKNALLAPTEISPSGQYVLVSDAEITIVVTLKKVITVYWRPGAVRGSPTGAAGPEPG